jgi:adenine-specific DNA-methyltransferase
MTIEKLDTTTPDLTKQNIERLAELFPECVTEGPKGTASDRGEPVIDLDLLRQALSDHLVEGTQERYRLDWPGKRQALLTANAPIDKTLRPMREESVDFDTTRNLVIEGDNLDALKLLQETYLGKVKMIYIDPPYNTGRNLIYKNDYSVPADDFLKQTGYIDVEGRALTANPLTNGRFHSDWLSSIFSPLKIARDLLNEDGVLVCAIDENELSTLDLVLKQIFGEGAKEYVPVSVVHNPRGVQGKNFSFTNEFALFVVPAGNKIIHDRVIKDEDVTWSSLRNWGGESERHDAKNCFYPVIVRDGEIVGFGEVCADDEHPSQTVLQDGAASVYPIDRNGVERKWRYARQSVEGIRNMLRARQTDYGFEIEIGKTFGLQKTVWNDTRYDSNQYGTMIVNDLIEGSGFTYPKSLWTVYDAVDAVCREDPDAIVLDFFAGSGTTAHACFLLNASDGGRRRSIMVQAPVPIEEEEKTGEVVFNTIAQLSRERIRRAGKKILNETPDLQEKLDTGFRAFRIDSGNFVDTRVTPQTASQDALTGMISHIKDDRSDEDLLFGALLRWGVDITLPIEKRELADRTIWLVDPPAEGEEGPALIACFARPQQGKGGINTEVADAIARLKPLRVLFRDDGFASDSVMENVQSRFKQLAPDTDVKVL